MVPPGATREAAACFAAASSASAAPSAPPVRAKISGRARSLWAWDFRADSLTTTSHAQSLSHEGRGDEALRVDRVFERAEARPLRLHQHGHVPWLVEVLPHLGVRPRDVGPGEDLG